MTVVGVGRLADDLRGDASLADVGVAVLVPPLTADARPFVEVDDATFAAAWEEPLRWAIDALQGAFHAGATRIVVVVPVLAICGGRDHAAAAAAAEAIRTTAKSAARQWGVRGVTVNTIVVPGASFGMDERAAGPSAIAPPALGPPVDVVAAVVAFAGGAARHVTGQTIVADGGTVMP